MEEKRTFGNHLLIKLDQENNILKLKNGVELYIDITFEPEKHATVTGEVVGLPGRLVYTGLPNKGMPWKTNMEIKLGDRVVIYYLAVLNALRKESYKAFIKGSDTFICAEYQNIYALVRNGTIIPINGYCLIEPCENPERVILRERMKKLNIDLILPEKSNTEVVFGKVKYMGRPNQEYVDGSSDDNVGINIGDTVVMRKISDLPLEYDLHAKIDSGKKYWRVQRRRILAIV